jgi:cell division protein FtsI/penicillin-binding protein 2
MVNGSKEEQEEPPKKIQLTIDNEVQSHQQGRRCLLSQKSG